MLFFLFFCGFHTRSCKWNIRIQDLLILLQIYCKCHLSTNYLYSKVAWLCMAYTAILDGITVGLNSLCCTHLMGWYTSECSIRWVQNLSSLSTLSAFWLESDIHLYRKKSLYNYKRLPAYNYLIRMDNRNSNLESTQQDVLFGNLEGE